MRAVILASLAHGLDTGALEAADLQSWTKTAGEYTAGSWKVSLSHGGKFSDPRFSDSYQLTAGLRVWRRLGLSRRLGVDYSRETDEGRRENRLSLLAEWTRQFAPAWRLQLRVRPELRTFEGRTRADHGRLRVLVGVGRRLGVSTDRVEFFASTEYLSRADEPVVLAANRASAGGKFRLGSSTTLQGGLVHEISPGKRPILAFETAVTVRIGR